MATLSAAYTAGVSAWRGERPEDLSAYDDLLWNYYLNRSPEVYTSRRIDSLRLEGRALYTYTRLIYNPVPQIVDFYVDHLFPHVSETLTSGIALATPMQDESSEELKEAVAQIDQWTNWLSEALMMVRLGASMGSVGVEVVDELEREKITHRILRPSLVKSVSLDAAGNVKAYTLEYKAYDEDKKENYTYRKEVDDELFQYFRDNKPYDPPDRGEGDEERIERGVYKNPYTFVPMVWIKHKDGGSERGLPAVVNIEKIDELNSLVSHRHDHQHKAIEAGKVISTDGDILPVTGASGASRKGQEGGINPYDTRRDWMLLKTPSDASVHNLGSSFDLTQGDPEVIRLLESFVADYPELQAAKLIEEHGATSGEALKYKLGKAQSKLDQAGAQYNQQVTKLKQMSVAIAGWRYNGGGWTKRDAQQKRFAPFNLESYAKGDLNFGIKRSLLVQMTETEEIELQGKRLENATKAEGMYDELTRLELAGESRDSAILILARRARIDPVLLAQQFDALESDEEGREEEA